MDEATIELIAQLCTRIGMLMEDHSDLALSLGRMDPLIQADSLAALDTVIGGMGALLTAAKALMDPTPPPL